MHGCPVWFWLAWCCLGVFGAGCCKPPPEVSATTRTTGEEAGCRFDPATVGRVQGQVRWQGEVPIVPAFRIRANQQPGSPPAPKLIHANPNQPVVDLKTGGVRSAVVFLRGIDLKCGKAWELPPACIEMRDHHYHIRQGSDESQVGFVRRGDKVTMVSADFYFYGLHAGGAAYFTLAFPDPQQPLRRPLLNKGLVELTSAAADYWMRAYLFVDEHPYYARTDRQGRFTLNQVPPGHYELVCWLPSWQVERRERDPETGQIARVVFRPPVEIVRSITIKTGGSATCDFLVGSDDFSGR